MKLCKNTSNEDNFCFVFSYCRVFLKVKEKLKGKIL